MKQPIAALFCICALVSVPAQADVRVLFRFDESGHHVHRVIHVVAQQAFKTNDEAPLTGIGTRRRINEPVAPPMSAIASGRSADHQQNSQSMQLLANPDRAGFAEIVWFDETGLKLSQTSVPDPRVTHSPLHIEGVNASRMALESGAWLATGPDTARNLTITLRADVDLGLGPELWQVSLPAPD